MVVVVVLGLSAAAVGVGAEAVMPAAVVQESLRIAYWWDIITSHFVHIFLYYHFLCLEHEQIKFESLNLLSLLSISWTFMSTLKTDMYRHVHTKTQVYLV